MVSRFHRFAQSLSRHLGCHSDRREAPRLARYRSFLQLEYLEDRTLPSILSIPILGGALSYTAGAGVANQFTVSVTGGTYTISDAENITLTGVGTAGWTGNGTQTVTGPSSSFSSAIVDLGDQNDTANVRSIDHPFTVLGGTGDDTFNVSSDAGNGPLLQGDLLGIASTLSIDAGIGMNNRLRVSNISGAGSTNAVITSSSITGMAPAVISYVATGGNCNGPGNDGIEIQGSNAAMNAGDTFNVQSTLAGSTTKIYGYAGDDVFNVSSDAPLDSGDLLGIAGMLTIDAGMGTNNRLRVSNVSGAGSTNAIITSNSITGMAPATINYTASGGAFNGPGNDGIEIQGSNAAMNAADQFTVQSTLVGSTTKIYGYAGNDTFIASWPLAGLLTVDGGAGAMDADSLTVNGTPGADRFDVRKDSITGQGAGVFYSAIGTLTINGLAGDDTFNVISTNATTITNLNGGADNDTFNISSDAGANPFLQGDLMGIAGPLNVEGGTGMNNRLRVSNVSGTGSSNAVITNASITGMAPAVINYTATGGAFSGPANDGIEIQGSNAAATNADTFNIRGTLAGSTTKIYGYAGDDTFNISSDAGLNANNILAGDLLGIQGLLSVDAGAGANNRLRVSNVSGTGSTNAIITSSSITGMAPVAINYTASGGTFNGPGNDGIEIQGSNAAMNASDQFTVQSTLVGSTTKVYGYAGNDTFNVSWPLAGLLTVDGGSAAMDNDTLTVNGKSGADTFNVSATAITGQGAGLAYTAITTLTINGIGGDDTFTVSSTSASTTTNLIGGAGNNTFTVALPLAGPLNIDGGPDAAADVDTLTVNGAVGADLFTVTDAAIMAAGSKPLTYKAIEILTINGQGGNDVFNVTSTPAGTVTNLNGGDSADVFLVSSDAGLNPLLQGDLSKIAGALNIDARGGANNRLIVSAFGATAPATLTLTSSSILNLAPAPIRYFASGGQFNNATASSNDGILIKGPKAAGAKGVGSTFNVQGTLIGSTTRIEGGDGDDTFIVSSDAPSSITPVPGSNARSVQGTLTIEAVGGSFNRLIVSDFGLASGVTATITNTSISGMTGDNAVIFYNASGGRFDDRAGPDGIYLWGSNTGDDLFNVQSTLMGSTTFINTGGGNDTVNTSSVAAGGLRAPRPLNNITVTIGGDLRGIGGPLSIDLGAGINTLNLSDFSNPLAPAPLGARWNGGSIINLAGPARQTPITYAATGGTVAVTLDSSDLVGDVITLASPLGNTVTLNGNGGNDVLTLDSSTGNTITLNGNAGNDILTVNGATGGAVNLSGGDGNDTISALGITNASLMVDGGTGDDTISLLGMSGGTASLEGGAGNDGITVTGITNVDLTASGGAGNDFISLLGSRGGSAVLNGGDGNNSISVAGAGVIAPSPTPTGVVLVAAGVSGTTVIIDGGPGSNVISLFNGVSLNGAGIGSINGGAGGNNVLNLNFYNGNTAVNLSATDDPKAPRNTFVDAGGGRSPLVNIRDIVAPLSGNASLIGDAKDNLFVLGNGVDSADPGPGFNVIVLQNCNDIFRDSIAIGKGVLTTVDAVRVGFVPASIDAARLARLRYLVSLSTAIPVFPPPPPI